MKNTKRYLTNGYCISNNTWETGLNNNDLICGATGCGKTRGYVIPNIKISEESMIICDTKGMLYGELAEDLRSRGYRVMNLDLVGDVSEYGYNPFLYIRKNQKTGLYREDDIHKLANAICPMEDSEQPFWENASKMFLEALIAYTLEAFPREYHNFDTVRRLAVQLGDCDPNEGGSVDKQCRIGVRGAYLRKFDSVCNTYTEEKEPVYLLSKVEICQAAGRQAVYHYGFSSMIMELEARKPDSIAAKLYNMFKSCTKAEKMYASIMGILAEKLNPLISNELIAVYKNPKQISFEEFGCRKTALFLTVSDTDRTKDMLANVMYTQALDCLIRSADRDYREHRLPVPVRFILDDFAASAIIPDFDNIISVIRSREISVSIIVQSISQLYDKYGLQKAATILNNCDHIIYLGGQDIATAEYISKRANKTLSSIIEQPITASYLLERGSKAIYLQGKNNTTMKGGMSYGI